MMDPLVQTLGKSFEILLRNLKLCLDLAKSPSVNMFVCEFPIPRVAHATKNAPYYYVSKVLGKDPTSNASKGRLTKKSYKLGLLAQPKVGRCPEGV